MTEIGYIVPTNLPQHYKQAELHEQEQQLLLLTYTYHPLEDFVPKPRKV